MLLTSTVIHDESFISVLNNLFLPLRYEKDGEYVNSTRLKFVVDKHYVDERCSFKTLESIILAEGNRDRALGDASKCMLRLRQFVSPLTESAKKAFVSSGLIDPSSDLTISGNGWYPEDSYMGWHTNRCTPGLRIYCNWASESGKSGLYYHYEGYDTGRNVLLDSEGWNFRMFSTDHHLKFWHAVFSHCDRVSLGFRVMNSKETDDV